MSVDAETIGHNEENDDDEDRSGTLLRRRRPGMGLSSRMRGLAIPSLERPFPSNLTTTFPNSTFDSEKALPVGSSMLHSGGTIVREAEERRKGQGELVITRSMLRALMASLGRAEPDGSNTIATSASGESSTAVTGGVEDADEEEDDENCPIQ